MVSATLEGMELMQPHERPTAQELAGGSAAGWTCRKCGCRDLRTLDTREQADGNIARTRYCRHCGPSGPRIYTTEAPYKVAE